MRFLKANATKAQPFTAIKDHILTTLTSSSNNNAQGKRFILEVTSDTLKIALKALIEKDYVQVLKNAHEGGEHNRNVVESEGGQNSQVLFKYVP